MIRGMLPVLVVALLQLFVGVSANVIGIDFASDSVKVAIVQPGTPLEIVTNFQSKRKTPVSITFYKGERMFGADSTALTARKPELSMSKLYRTLGRSVDHPLVKELDNQYFPFDISANETTGVATYKIEEAFYTSEELVAMMLSHVKDMTANFGGKKIKDCVITVPSSFTQHERDAVYTAAEIADLNVLTLIEENTAAALHYGIDRVFEEPQTVIYYNLGAGSAQVTIATYSSYTVKEAGKNKSIGQFEVVGKAWDTSVGGFNFDVRLAELLAARFNDIWAKKKSFKAGDDVTKFKGPMTRLRLEASKIKEILSANQEFPVKSDGLHADVDLQTKVSRVQFEEACADLFEKLTGPIDKALQMAGMTLADVHAVELLGGGVRMPKVRQVLSTYFAAAPTPLEVGQHMNGDESMALGAAFRAANISTAFRVRKVGVSDISAWGISVTLNELPTDETVASGGGLFASFMGGAKATATATAAAAAAAEGDAEVWSKHSPIYLAGGSVPGKMKTLAFHYDKDVVCRVQYNDTLSIMPLPEGTNPLIRVYNITGIADFSKEATTKGALTQPKISLQFGLDSSGQVSLVKAEATVELPKSQEEIDEEAAIEVLKAAAAADEEAKKIDDEAKKIEEETKKKDEAEESESETADADVDTDSEKDTTTEGSSKKTKDSKKDKKDKKEDKKNEKKEKTNADKLKEAVAKFNKKKNDSILRASLPFRANIGLVSPPMWTPSMIAESKQKLRTLQEADDARTAKEAALNELEGYIYKVKNHLTDEEEALKAVSTEEQRAEVMTIANDAEEWLYDEGRFVGVTVYNERKAEIAAKYTAIVHRFSELSARAAVTKKARETCATIRDNVSNWAEKKVWIDEEEKAAVEDAITTAEKWLDEKLEAQAALTAFEEPAFESTDVPRQFKSAVSLYERTNKKPKPLPPKVEVNETAVGENETVKVELEESDADATEPTAEGETEAAAESDAEETTTTEKTEDADAEPSADEPEL